MGVEEDKSAVTPLSFKIQITIDETFKMRYITSLNSQWIQRYKPSKLNGLKNVRFSTKRTFFSIVALWQLVSLEPLGVQRRNVPHFKGLIYAKVELEAQGRNSTFTFHHALLKKAIL